MLKLCAPVSASKTNFSSKPVHPQPRITRIIRANAHSEDHAGENSSKLSRRDSLMALVIGSQLMAMSGQQALAVQGLTAGRIPGLSTTADENGFYFYARPEGKSGGHGVGWSEIPRYSFKVPATWQEIPVSIADLGGTEIDLRYTSKEQGELAVVVAPVMRFSDIGFNANVKIENLGTPSKIISGFGPELFGKTVDDEDVIDTRVENHNGLTYYYWQVRPFNLVSATAVRNRMFILSLRSNARQWKKHSNDLLEIQKSFDVPYELSKEI